MWGMWEKFRFQLPVCQNGSCCGMWMHIIVEQNNLLGKQTIAIVIHLTVQPSPVSFRHFNTF
jgi:hypothetical protein